MTVRRSGITPIGRAAEFFTQAEKIGAPVLGERAGDDRAIAEESDVGVDRRGAQLVGEG